MSISRGLIPLLGWLSGYRRKWNRCDLVVGLYSTLIPLVTVAVGIALAACDQLLLKIEGNVHFANASRLGDLSWPLIHRYQPRVLALDCSAMPSVEYTALKMLAEAEEKLREAGIVLWLAALNPEPLQLIQKTSLGEALGRERMIYSLKHALEEDQTRYAAEPTRKD